MRVQRRVEQLHWRLDSLWSKMQVWFRDLDNTKDQVDELQRGSKQKT